MANPLHSCSVDDRDTASLLLHLQNFLATRRDAQAHLVAHLRKGIKEKLRYWDYPPRTAVHIRQRAEQLHKAIDDVVEKSKQVDARFDTIIERVFPCVS